MDAKDYKALDRHVRGMVAEMHGIRPKDVRGGASPIDLVHSVAVSPGLSTVVVVFNATGVGRTQHYHVMPFNYCPTAERNYGHDEPIKRKMYTPTFNPDNSLAQGFSGDFAEALALHAFGEQLKTYYQQAAENVAEDRRLLLLDVPKMRPGGVRLTDAQEEAAISRAFR